MPKRTWYLPSQLVEANGDVVYRQVEPNASFTGQKPLGKSKPNHCRQWRQGGDRDYS